MNNCFRSPVLALAFAAAGWCQTTSSQRLLVVDVANVKARVQTTSALQTSTVHGQIAFRHEALADGSQTLVLAEFSLRGTSVNSPLGPTGVWSVSLKPKSAVTKAYSPSTGAFRVEYQLMLDYDLLEARISQRKVAVDAWVLPQERLTGGLDGQFTKLLGAQTTTNSLAGTGRATLVNALLGPIRAIELNLAALPASVVSGSCMPKGLRTLPLQPVFIGSGPNDVTATGRSLESFVEHAEAIWRKACVTFEIREPMYVGNAAYKVLTEAGSVDLRAEVNDDDAIEIFFIESWDPIGTYGGGATWASGSARAKIITADNNIDQNPPSLNHLAHELGHVLGFCHPDADECSDPMVRAAPGTVMEGSGFWADNPDRMSLVDCFAASNSLLTFKKLHCCFQPDCANDCR